MHAEDKFVNDQMVLVVAQTPEFAQSLVARWKKEGSYPSFTVMTPGSNGMEGGGHYAACHLVIVEGRALQAHRGMLQRLELVGVPIVCAGMGDEQKSARRGTRMLRLEPAALTPERLRAEFPRALPITLPSGEEGFSTLVLFAGEVLRRVNATLRVKKAEAAAEPESARLALGKYVVDSMHGFNNALTAVLGNAELLMIDSEKLTPAMQEQVEAIHSNAIRLHEMMQRFSSLEAEMNAGRKEGHSEAAMAVSQAYLSGT